MRIGIDARLYRSSAAGIGRYSQNLIKNLLELDKENEYVLFMKPDDKQEFDNWIIENSLKIDNCKLKIVDIPHYSLSEQTKLAKIIEKENCDLVHFLNFNHPVRYKGKFIVTIHDLTLLFYPEVAKRTNFIKQAAFRYVFKKACKNSSQIIAVSKNTKNDIIKTFHIAPEKISVIYEAADDKEINKKGIRKNKEKIILYVGQFRRHKNIKGLLEAFAILKKEIPAKLVLLGKIPEDFRIDSKAILRDTIMPGFVSDEDLAKWYKRADVFVFPSLYEGFGLPGLEAMQAGLPVVSSNKSSLPEVYGNAALYFDPLNPKEIADKIKLVLSDSKIREKLVERGRIQAKKYSWKKTAEETLKLYSEV